MLKYNQVYGLQYHAGACNISFQLGYKVQAYFINQVVYAFLTESLCELLWYTFSLPCTITTFFLFMLHQVEEDGVWCIKRCTCIILPGIINWCLMQVSISCHCVSNFLSNSFCFNALSHFPIRILSPRHFSLTFNWPKFMPALVILEVSLQHLDMSKNPIRFSRFECSS